MKNAVSFTTVFFKVLTFTMLLSAFTLGACTPEDKGVTNDRIRNMIQQKNKKKKGDFFQVGSFAMNSLMSDKILESAEIVRLAYQKENSAKTFYKVEAQPDQEDGSHVLLLTADQKDFSYSTSQGAFLSSIKKQWKVIVATSENPEVLLLAKAVNSEESLKKQGGVAGKESLVNFNETASAISIKTISDNDSALAMTFSSDGNLNASLKGNSTSEKFNTIVTVNIEKAAFLEKGEIKILNVALTTAFAKAKKPYMIRGNSGTLVLNADGLCSSLEGSLSMGKRSLTLEKEQVYVEGTGYKSSLAACGQRPTVDLSRLLIK